MCSQNLRFVAFPVPEIIGVPEKNWAVPGYVHAPFSPKFLMGFCSDGPSECTGQIWNRSLTRSSDNSDWSFGWGANPKSPILGEGMVPLERALMSSYRLSVRAISFQDCQPMWSWFTNVTDGQTTCDRKTALCTIVHRAVKTILHNINRLENNKCDSSTSVPHNVTLITLLLLCS